MTDTTPFQLVTQEDIIEGVVGSDHFKTNLLFNTASDFSHFIEMTALKENKTCTQVILDYCDERDLEPQDIAKLITLSLRGKIHVEMIDKGLLPEQNTLD